MKSVSLKEESLHHLLMIQLTREDLRQESLFKALTVRMERQTAVPEQ